MRNGRGGSARITVLRDLWKEIMGKGKEANTRRDFRHDEFKRISNSVTTDTQEFMANTLGRKLIFNSNNGPGRWNLLGIISMIERGVG